MGPRVGHMPQALTCPWCRPGSIARKHLCTITWFHSTRHVQWLKEQCNSESFESLQVEYAINDEIGEKQGINTPGRRAFERLLRKVTPNKRICFKNKYMT